MFEFHLSRWLGNQLSSHNLSGNTSLVSTLVFFSFVVSKEIRRKWLVWISQAEVRAIEETEVRGFKSF